MIFNSNDLHEGQLVKRSAANVVSITDTVTCALIIAIRTAVANPKLLRGQNYCVTILLHIN